MQWLRHNDPAKGRGASEWNAGTVAVGAAADVLQYSQWTAMGTPEAEEPELGVSLAETPAAQRWKGQVASGAHNIKAPTATSQQQEQACTATNMTSHPP